MFVRYDTVYTVLCFVEKKRNNRSLFPYKEIKSERKRMTGVEICETYKEDDCVYTDDDCAIFQNGECYYLVFKRKDRILQAPNRIAKSEDEAEIRNSINNLRNINK